MDFENIAVGIDIEDISRFLNKDDEFYERVFTAGEIEYCRSKIKPEQHFAARYCAKEAVIKALSNFGVDGFTLNKIEIFKDNSNIPRVRFLDGLKGKFEAKLSLSHDKTKAAAYVIIKKN